MSLKKFVLIALGIFLFGGSVVFAQDKAAEEQKSVFNFDGVLFMNWSEKMNDKKDNEAANKTNTFALERIYLNFRTKINEVWSARVTVDSGYETAPKYKTTTTVSGASGATATSTTSADSASNETKYSPFIKYAYMQAQHKMDPVEMKFQLGVIETPMIGFIDGLADQRWLTKNFIDDSKAILGLSIDHSADMGAALSIKAMKMVEIAGAYTNGEGYKYGKESNYSSKDGKAVYARATVNPIEQLFISGFFRRNGEAGAEDKFNTWYYGGGVAWADKMIKAGVNYIMAGQKTDGTATKNATDGKEYKYTLIDSWLTFNLAPVANIPAFISARYAIGDNNQTDGKITYMGAGAGYEFNSKVRAALWYTSIDNKANDTAKKVNPDNTIAVKFEVKI